MKLSNRFSVIGNKIHFSYMDFAGYIEAVFECSRIWYKTSITKDGVNFSTMNHSKLGEAFEFLEEYNQQMIAERSAEYGQK